MRSSKKKKGSKGIFCNGASFLALKLDAREEKVLCADI